MAKRKSPKESTIVRSILDELRSRGPAVWFRKNHGGPFGSSGVPDIEVVFRPVREIPRDDEDGSTTLLVADHAIVAFVEVKKPGKEPTDLQRATMGAIKRAGGFVVVAWSKKDAIEFLESIGLPRRETTNAAT